MSFFKVRGRVSELGSVDEQNTTEEEETALTNNPGPEGSGWVLSCPAITITTRIRWK